MTYLALDAVFLAAAALVLAIAVVRRRAPRGPALGAALAVVLVMTVVFDNLMIAAGLFHYAEDQLVGLHLGLVPVEDLAYPIAGVLLLPALWHLLGGPAPAAGEPR